MKYGMLTVFEKVKKKENENRWLYRCVCDCGNECLRSMNNLKWKGVHSCGCNKGANKKHGMKETRVYRVWSGMKNRCTNPKDKDYAKYSKLGISDRWLKFELFLIDMGESPSGSHSIDRIDNDKGYFKGNCRWATRSQQQRNKSNSKVWIAEGTEFDSISDVAKAYGVSRSAAHRWFVGYKSRGKNYPPKNGFFFRSKYEDN